MGQEEEILKEMWEPGLPKVLRGLPRWYKWQDRCVSKVKEHFDDFEVIKARYLEKFELREFSGKNLPESTHAVLFTWVIGDGWGDYYMQLDAREVLHEAYPELRLTLITLIHKDKTLPQENCGFAHHVFKYTGTSRVETIYEEFSDEVYEEIKTAALFLQLPTCFPHTANLLKRVKHKPRYELIGECGFIDSSWFHPKTGAHCMGLHFLEKGILITNAPKCIPTTCFNLDYTKTARGNYLFLHILLKALENDHREITIATSSLQLYIDHLENGLKSLLERFGIKELVIHFVDSICPIKIANHGKKLIVKHSKHLAHAEFIKQIGATDQLVGCTGDGSISQALSCGKSFFYDAPLHKRNFLKDLIALADDRLTEFPETVAFLKLSLKNAHLILEDVVGGWVSEEFIHVEQEKTSSEDLRDEVIAEKMGELLQSPATKEGFIKLSNIIQKEYALNETLCQIIARASRDE